MRTRLFLLTILLGVFSVLPLSASAQEIQVVTAPVTVRFCTQHGMANGSTLYRNETQMSLRYATVAPDGTTHFVFIRKGDSFKPLAGYRLFSGCSPEQISALIAPKAPQPPGWGGEGI